MNKVFIVRINNHQIQQHFIRTCNDESAYCYCQYFFIRSIPRMVLFPPAMCPCPRRRLLKKILAQGQMLFRLCILAGSVREQPRKN